MSAGDVPRAAEITVDAGVLLFTLALSLLTGLVFGLLPALQASRSDLQGTLKEGGRGQAGAGGGRLRSVLVVAEVAVAVVLLVGSGLLLRGLSRLVDVDPGFDPRGALTAQLDLPESKYPQDADQARFYRRLFDRLAALPGVERAGGVLPMPLTGSGFVLDFWVEGTPVPEPNKSPFSNVRVVNEDYFEAMKIPLLRGRVFTPADDFGAPWVVVINDSTAAKYFPGQDPIGERLTFDDPEGEEIRWMTIVGVVGDVHHEDLAAATEPELYWSYAQRPVDGTTVVLRAAGDPAALAGPLRSAVAEIDPDLPVYAVRPLEQIVDDSVAQPRFNSLLWGLFAGLALLLAVIGVYGVISYAVAQRRREIGVRLALGAERRRILGLVLKGGMGLVSIGLAAGLALSVPAARLLAGMVYEIGTTDPATYAGVAVLLAVVGAAACLVPALRATRVDPVVVLREE
jgi:predicted permease